MLNTANISEAGSSLRSDVTVGGARESPEEVIIVESEEAREGHSRQGEAYVETHGRPDSVSREHRQSHHRPWEHGAKTTGDVNYRYMFTRGRKKAL